MQYFIIFVILLGVILGITFVTSDVRSKNERRFVLDSTTASPDKVISDLQHQVQQLQHQLVQLNHSLTSQILHLRQAQSVVYTRWGRKTCNGHGAHTLYTGYAAGPPYGRDDNTLCIPTHPTWSFVDTGYDVHGGVIGPIQYQMDSNYSLHAFGKNLNDFIMPCSSCQVPRTAIVMIPGMTNCPQHWIPEYQGYLMGASSFGGSGSEYICVDQHAQTIPSGNGTYSKGVYIVEVKCGVLPCSTYPDGQEIACVVCSK